MVLLLAASHGTQDLPACLADLPRLGQVQT